MTLARQLGFVLEASVQTSRAGDLLQSAKGVLWDAAPCRNRPRVFCGMQHYAGNFVGCDRGYCEGSTGASNPRDTPRSLHISAEHSCSYTLLVSSQ